MKTFYNDNDAAVAAWLGELIKAGLVPDGAVSTQSIHELTRLDIGGGWTCHFFAGIGGWPLALRLAGWPNERAVWTGSCPCQPFSCAGRGGGESDSRHLWPEFRRLIAECRPPVVFGEQVASRLGREWLAGVRADLEALGYEVGASDLCAAGVGAPHVRQRLYWVADTTGTRYAQTRERADLREERSWECVPGDISRAGGLANTGGAITEQSARSWAGPDAAITAGAPDKPDGCGVAGWLEHPASNGRQQRGSEPGKRCVERGRLDGWATARWHTCLDGKLRRIPPEPEFFPLAHGLSGRVGLLRGYGNAIVPQVAATFVRAFMEAVGIEPVLDGGGGR